MENFTTYTRTRNGKTQTVTRVVYSHGLSKKEHLYKIWQGMRRRCNEPQAQNYKWYGGKGIEVCEEWQQSYMVFREWALSNGYCEGLELDRIDTDKNYEPSNCRWITKKANIRSRDLYWDDELDGRLVEEARRQGINVYEFIKISVEYYLDHK